MKKIILFFLILSFVNITNAQEKSFTKSLKIQAGFWTNLQGSIPLKEPKETKFVPEMLNVYLFNINKWTFTPFLKFELGGAAVGSFLSYEMIEECDFSIYTSYTKELFDKNGAIVVGIDKILYDNPDAPGIDVFIEFASITGKFDPVINVGIIILTTKVLRE
jgi:hypothetical protein